MKIGMYDHINYETHNGKDIVWRVKHVGYHHAYTWQHRFAYVMRHTFIAYRYY